MCVTKAHRVLSYTIPMDEKLPRHLHGFRRTAFTDLKKYFYKLMNNAVFGKL